MPKVNRNEKCPCNSEKKYKQCCLKKDKDAKIEENEKYIRGHDDYSETLRIFAEYLEEEYNDHKIINISNHLNSDNYKNYQIKHYNSKVFMIAERNTNNDAVFKSRGGTQNDILIMYRGSYRTFNNDEMMSALESIDKMIQTRLAGLDDK